MRYTIVRYGYPNQLNDASVPIGVVVQSDEALKYKFDLSKERFQYVNKIVSNADPDTFYNFENSFIENFVKPGKIFASDGLGNRIEILITQPEFLKYLNSKYLGNYSYSTPTTIEGDDINRILEYLYTSIIVK